MAFADMEEAERCGGLDFEGFTDCAWGYIEQDICAAMRQRTGGDGPRLKGEAGKTKLDPGEPLEEEEEDEDQSGDEAEKEPTLIHALKLDLGEQAFALLQACAIHDGHESAEACARHAVAEWIHGYARQGLDAEKLEEVFGNPLKSNACRRPVADPAAGGENSAEEKGGRADHEKGTHSGL